MKKKNENDEGIIGDLVLVWVAGMLRLASIVKLRDRFES